MRLLKKQKTTRLWIDITMISFFVWVGNRKHGITKK
nr:MAG TPA: hypothetical protein [Caudoviricetes sp.]